MEAVNLVWKISGTGQRTRLWKRSIWSSQLTDVWFLNSLWLQETKILGELMILKFRELCSGSLVVLCSYMSEP